MLQDPRWNKEPSLAGFALFVASKEPGERYEWASCRACAVGQYLASIGQDLPLSEWTGDIAVANQLAHGGVLASLGAAPPQWTFGALADRILAYQMREPVAA